MFYFCFACSGSDYLHNCLREAFNMCSDTEFAQLGLKDNLDYKDNCNIP